MEYEAKFYDLLKAWCEENKDEEHARVLVALSDNGSDYETILLEGPCKPTDISFSQGPHMRHLSVQGSHYPDDALTGWVIVNTARVLR